MNTTKNLLGCEIYIRDNKPLFQFLKNQRQSIEEQLDGKLEWIEAKKASRAIQRRENADIENEKTITAHFDWLIERAIAFDKVFGPLVKKFKEQ